MHGAKAVCLGEQPDRMIRSARTFPLCLSLGDEDSGLNYRLPPFLTLHMHCLNTRLTLGGCDTLWAKSGISSSVLNPTFGGRVYWILEIHSSHFPAATTFTWGYTAQTEKNRLKKPIRFHGHMIIHSPNIWKPSCFSFCNYIEPITWI